MHFAKWNMRFFKQFLPFTDGAGPAVTRAQTSLYQIITVCKNEEAAYIESLLMQGLQPVREGIERVDFSVNAQSTLTRITAEVRCSVAGRGHLVRLLSRLGLEQGVRTVRWQGLPERA